MATAKQVLDARAAGYSDSEIAQHLGGDGYQKARTAGYSDQEIINHFLPQGDQTLLGNLSSLDNRGPLDDLSSASKAIGNMVKGGVAGIANLVPGAVKAAGDVLTGQPEQGAQDFTAGLPAAATDVQNVEEGQPATTTAGKVGSTVGSFFTPNQIALQALGGVVAQPIATGVGNAASAIMRGLSDVLPEAATKVSKFFGADPQALAALAENPEAVSSAQTMKSAAEDTGSFLKGISKRGQALADTAKSALSDETEVDGAVDAAQQGLSKLTKADVGPSTIKDTLDEIVKSLGKDPSEQNVQEMLDKLDEEIPYNSKNPSYEEMAARDVRQKLSNLLKAQNSEYKAGMEASSATREPMRTLGQNLGVQKGLPGDWTINALKKVVSPDALATQRALGALPGGTQLAGNVANSAAKAALQQGLIGKLALMLGPNANQIIQGGVNALPAAGNAASQAWQGLTQ